MDDVCTILGGEKRPKGNSRYLRALRRTLKFLRPQRSRIVLAIFAAIGLASTLAISLSTIPWILYLFVTNPDGPRAAVFQIAAQRVLRADFEPYRPDVHDSYRGEINAKTALIFRDVKEHSPLLHYGAQPAMLIQPVSTELADRAAFFEAMAEATRHPVTVRFVPVGDKSAFEADIQYVPDSLKERLLNDALIRFGQWLPADRSLSATRAVMWKILAGVFLVVLFGSFCQFASEFLVTIIATRGVMDMRREMYRTVMGLPLTWFGRHLSETMSRVVTDCKDVMQGYQAMFGKLLTEPFKVVAMLIGALIFDWRITIFVLIVAPIGGIIISIIGRKIRKANRRLLGGYAQMMSVINATLSGVRIVRAYNNQHFERRRMWRAERRLLQQLLKIGRLDALTSPLLGAVGIFFGMLGMAYLADCVVAARFSAEQLSSGGGAISGRFDPEKFIGVALLLGVMLDSLKKIAEIYPRLSKADGAATRVFEIIDMPVEEDFSLGLPNLPVLHDRIEFRNVSYTYPETDRPALSEICLTIQKGQRVAIVGPNGSGKTTLMGLLECFFRCDHGQILLDGRDINQYNIRSLREQISLITQDAVIFAATALENIVYGGPDTDAKKAIEAAKHAYAHEFIERLPDGYQTMLGEFGATLSGGERQRLALARAIFRNAPIFIFDEATSQIDVDSEKKIHQATREFMANRTSIVIAHRIATIIDADVIVVMDQGRIVDIGDHATLLQRCLLYKTLYTTHTAPQ